MALVVLLRGVNVGGHRVFRPTQLAARLKHLGVINIGAAGTFIIQRPVTRTQLRAELARALPFDTHIVICNGSSITKLVTDSAFAKGPAGSGVVRFLTVLSRLPRAAPSLPICLPSRGEWLVRAVAREQQFVFGEYRRHLKTIRYLGELDKLFGVPATTRNWNTIVAIAKLLERAHRRERVDD